MPRGARGARERSAPCSQQSHGAGLWFGGTWNQEVSETLGAAATYGEEVNPLVDARWDADALSGLGSARALRVTLLPEMAGDSLSKSPSQGE